MAGKKWENRQLKMIKEWGPYIKCAQIGKLIGRSTRATRHKFRELEFQKWQPQTGDTINRLKILDIYRKPYGKVYKTYAKCECQCKDKNITNVRLTSLKQRKIESCGCVQKERARQARIEVNQRPTQHIKNQDVEKICKLYQDGWDKNQLSKKYKISPPTVDKYLRENNIKVRGNYEAKTLNRTLDEDFFEKINTEEKAYWLGFLMADGTISGNQINLGLARVDREHLVKFKHIIHASNKIQDYIEKEKYEGSKISFRSQKMVNDLAELGCIQNKTMNLKPPEINNELKKHFIRGFIDGDGSIGNYNPGGWTISCYGTHEMMEFILNYFKGFCYTTSNVNPRKNGFEISISGNNMVPIILKHLYQNSTIFLDRKFKLAQESGNWK